MIAVEAKPADLEAASEFFELFKTAWEPARRGRRYRVALTSGDGPHDLDADVILAYGASEHPIDRDARIECRTASRASEISWSGFQLPIYGRSARFIGSKPSIDLICDGEPVGYRRDCGSRVFWRIGYDLFAEVRHLLTAGQPATSAITPVLELHIDILRQILVASGVTFVEIPPRPEGYDFTCCLTHDIDFFGIRRHKLDRTIMGFVARASVGTLVDLVRGRRSTRDAARNLVALLSLPLVFLKVLPDFWRPFEDYARIEQGDRSTFFVVPFKNRPGTAPDGTVDVQRKVSYGISDIRRDVEQTISRGSEIAVHGIDAWRDSDAANAELREVTGVTKQRSAGIRMHWLYFGLDSPQHLESAGFDYDSTWGFNDAIGYRAGTSQVFRLTGSNNLLELPLSIMDSALFFSGRMGLAPQKALQLCRQIVAHASRFGGTVVINWHERSLAPERLWDGTYRLLLGELEKNRVWFARAGQAVDWFRWRRSIRFTTDENRRALAITAPGPAPSLPAAIVRTYRTMSPGRKAVEEFRFDGQTELCIKT